MKKVLALIVAVAMACTMGVFAMAADASNPTTDTGNPPTQDTGTPPETPSDSGPTTPDDNGDDTQDNAETGGGGSGGSGGSSATSGSSANSKETTAAIENTIAALADPSVPLPAKAQTVSTASGKDITVIPVKMSSGDAISLDTADLLGSGSDKMGLQANVNGGAMIVTIPGGFGKVTDPSRIYFPMIYDANPYFADKLLASVKGENAKSEALKAGGSNMVMPVDVTLSLKTKLSGTVNVYYYDEITGKYTLLATTEAENGRITFATRQMGAILLTTGTI